MPAALQVLRDHAARFRLRAPLSPYVFKHLTAQSGEPGTGLATVSLSFKRAAKKIGLPTLRPHDLAETDRPRSSRNLRVVGRAGRAHVRLGRYPFFQKATAAWRNWSHLPEDHCTFGWSPRR